eukprot:CAMPEP_0115221458 /NCGR_PEP_ID=MMETSP0270-20121206/27978_1 /TAXON_ID=71861 /ORGANISM="Scrippsiella trochoidea, Strain CCMP3099" /LENGTH=64 /DNA_ID=CAMNT_0002635555 /DNA_START=92 /DNA_END=283 /DNA_ORIENTATION=+
MGLRPKFSGASHNSVGGSCKRPSIEDQRGKKNLGKRLCSRAVLVPERLHEVAQLLDALHGHAIV